MNTPNPQEALALNASPELLKFAAENKSGLPVPVITNLEAAWTAVQNGTWNDAVATNFWTAYDGLCTHLRPINSDTLAAATKPTRNFGGRQLKGRSLSQKWALGFFILLILIACISMLAAFTASTAETLIKETNELIAKGDRSVVDIRKSIADIEAGLFKENISFDTNLANPKLPSDVKKSTYELMNQAQDMYFVADRMFQKINATGFRLLFVAPLERCTNSGQINCYDEGPLTDPAYLQHIRENIVSYYKTRRAVTARKDQGDTRLGVIKSYLLPALLGMLGASTFVVRYIADQIKDTTFSPNSPIRHMMRIALGAVAGLVVTFGLLSAPASLSVSALAFIAGYSLEAVFSAIDAVVKKFQ